MSPAEHQQRRSYHAPRRQAAAARTREAILIAAKSAFEERGWAGTRVREISDGARVSQKTVEALFGTKAALLRAAVDFAIRGDIEDTPMPQRDSVARMESAANASAMLRLHARHLRTINERSARMAAVVEQAAPADPAVADLWEQMNRNRTYGVAWATTTLMTKPGRRPRLTRRDVEATFWVALDWNTYRTLTTYAGLVPDAFEAWLRRYYAALLVAPRPA